MRVAISGATGLVGGALVAALRQRGDEVTVLSRDPARVTDVEAHAWDVLAGPPPAEALAGRDAVVHLAGATVAQRWTRKTKAAIRNSRVKGTANLVTALGDLPEAERPPVLVCASAAGFYGPRDDEPIDEAAPAGSDFLAAVCVGWEGAARTAQEHGVRVVSVRTGVVLDGKEGALGKMLLPFKLGAGGPVAGGRQYMPWIHRDDIVALYLAAMDDDRYTGPVNGSAPDPVTNKAFSKALGRVLRRPAIAPVPALAIKALYGEMSTIVTTGVNMVPRRAQELGFTWRFTDVESALRDLGV